MIIKTGTDIKKAIKDLFDAKLDKRKLYKALYLYRSKNNGCSYNESINFLVIHMLSFFRVCETHKDLLYGLGRRIYIEHVLEYLSKNSNIELSISDIFTGNLEAIGTSYKELNGLAELDKFLGKERQEINIKYVEKQGNCFVKNEAWYVAGMDIRNETRGLIDKFKVICKIITDLYLLPSLRNNGIYYGELNIIEDVLRLIINNHGLYISMNDIANDIKQFVINSEANIINIYQDLYSEFYKEKEDRYSNRNDSQILCDLLDEVKRDVSSKEIQISHKELDRIINIIMKFPQKSKISTLQNNNGLKSNYLESSKIEDCKF